jgi:ribose/xylose/arabinose/galactoside ABC-type transport system permease subunit
MTTTLQFPPTPTQPRRQWRIGAVIAKLRPLIGLAFVFGLFAILRPGTFVTWSNMEIILLQTAVVGTAALGMTLIIISGGIDLSVGSAIALVTIVIARLLSGFDVFGRHLEPQSPVIAALAGVGAGVACGLLVGTLIARMNLAPFIVTLGAWGILRGLAKGMGDNGRVTPPGHSIDNWLGNLMRIVSGTDDARLLLPMGVWIMLILAVLVTLLLRYTRFGRRVYAIGSNELTARLCGVPVPWTKTWIYGLAGAFFGMAGVLQFAKLTCGDSTAAEGMELDIIAACVIGGASLSGGQGSVLGSLIGALLMTTVANGCTKVGLSNWVQEIVTGGIIVLAVALDRLRQRRSA